MGKTIVLASNNQAKLAELRDILRNAFDEIKCMADFGLDSPLETGATFIENAIIKARFVSKATQLPTLADDSGLCVPALQGAPGLYSSRYAGEAGNHYLNVAKLLAATAGMSVAERQAYFYCAVVVFWYPDDPAPLMCDARWEGSILNAPQGSGGFGYDPIFYVPTHDCSAANLSMVEKNRVSHRAQALQKLGYQL